MAKDKGNPYGLPELTIEEAARVLGLEVAAFELWLWKVFPKSPQQRSMWFGRSRHLPEDVIRYYLAWKIQQQAESKSPPAPPAATEPEVPDEDEEPQQERAVNDSRSRGKPPHLERRGAGSRGSKRARRA